MWNVFETLTTSSSGALIAWPPCSYVLRDARAEPPVDEHARQQYTRSHQRQIEMANGRRHPLLDHHRPGELDDRRRWPEIQIEVVSLRDNTKRIDDRGKEEPCLGHDVPDLVQVAVAEEEDAAGQREADDDEAHRQE